MRHTHSATQPPEVTCAHPEHVPRGPWHVNAVRGPRIVGDETTTEPFDKLMIHGENRTIATVYRRNDARLIAEAPAMLEMLRHLYRWHDQIGMADVGRLAEMLARIDGDAA